MSEDDLLDAKPRGAPAMGRRGGGGSSENAAPSLAADFDASDDGKAASRRQPGGWATDDTAPSSGWTDEPRGGVAESVPDRDFPVRRERVPDGTPGANARRNRMDRASKHEALETREKEISPDVPEIPSLTASTRAHDDSKDRVACDVPEYAARGSEVRSVDELNRAASLTGFRDARRDRGEDGDYGDYGAAAADGRDGWGGDVDVSLLASAFVPAECLEEGEDAQLWSPDRLWNAVKTELRLDEARRLKADRQKEDDLASSGAGVRSRVSDDAFEETAVGGNPGVTAFASPIESATDLEEKNREGVLRKKLTKLVAARG